MNILMTGATGLIGTQLGIRLASDGHKITVLSRNPTSARERLPFPCRIHAWDAESEKVPGLGGIEAVIHLAGEPIADGRWTPERKSKLIGSRVISTTLLMKAIGQIPESQRAKTIITASAIGYYGDRGDEVLTEASAPGSGFLSQICQEWEAAARDHAPPEMRLATVRIGIVLDRQGGALGKLFPIFNSGVGGPVGGGKQWMSWIHRDDLLNLFVEVLENPKYSGAINAVSPNPVPNREFSQELGKALEKPAFIPVPAFGLRVALGEMADVVLWSQRVTPKVALSNGFHFKFLKLEGALQDLCTEGDEELVAYQWVGRPVDEVFPFFSKAENLEVLTPGFLGFKILSQSTPTIQNGTLIDYRIKVHGVPLTWRTQIMDWSPPHQFVDTQLKGPYTKWHHTHTFTSVQGGTLMKDRVRYRVPAGTLGQAAAGSFVRGDVRKIFKYRRDKIIELFGAPQ